MPLQMTLGGVKKPRVPTGGIVPPTGPGTAASGPNTYDVGGDLITVPHLAPIATGAGSGLGTGSVGATATAPPPVADPLTMGKLTNDEVYRAALARVNAAIGAGRLGLRDQIRSSIIQSGFVPDLHGELADYANDVDAQTIAAAQGNQMSAKAQLDRSLKNQQTLLDYDLAARGSGLSGRGGAAAVGGGLLQDQYNTASYNQMNSLLAALGGNVHNFLDLQNSQQSSLDPVLEGVATRLSNLQAPLGADSTVTGGDPTATGGDPTLSAPAPQWATQPQWAAQPAAKNSPLMSVAAALAASAAAAKKKPAAVSAAAALAARSAALNKLYGLR
jgi:hypothetical protein